MYIVNGYRDGHKIYWSRKPMYKAIAEQNAIDLSRFSIFKGVIFETELLSEGVVG